MKLHNLKNQIDNKMKYKADVILKHTYLSEYRLSFYIIVYMDSLIKGHKNMNPDIALLDSVKPAGLILLRNNL